MASEKSKSEIEVVQKESQQNPKSEESQTDSEVKSEQSQEKIEGTSQESSQTTQAEVKEESQVDQKAVQDTQTEDNTDNSGEQEAEKVNPPPPPTSGDLIGLIEPPTFPKDLVGSRSEGTVRLMVELSSGGNVKTIEVLESSGYDSMDRVAQLTLEHGWEFKEYQRPYRIPVSVRYYIDESDNSQVEVDIGQVEFISGGE